MSMRMSYFGTLSFLAASLWLLFPTSGAQAAEKKSKDGVWVSIDREDLAARKRSKAKAWIQPEKMGAFELRTRMAADGTWSGRPNRRTRIPTTGARPSMRSASATRGPAIPQIRTWWR